MPLPAGYKVDDKSQPLSIAQLKEQAAKLQPQPLGIDKPTANLLVHIRAPHLRATEQSEHARQLVPAGSAPAANVQPTASWGDLRTAVLGKTEPAPTDDPVTLTMKRTARGLFGVADFVPQTAGIVRNLFSSDPNVSSQAESDLLSLHPGAQISDRGKEAIEEWKQSPKLATANAVGDALALFLTDKLTPIHEKETTLYHGSPSEIPSLQAGSMLTPDKAWAAGYATKTDMATGKESFSGNVYSTNLPKGNILTVNGSLHDLEQHLVNMGRQAGVTSGGLKGIAEEVAKHTGYDAIVGKSPNGKITGAIVLKEHPHTGKLDPRTAVQETKSQGLPIASNLEKLILPETIEESMPGAEKVPDRRMDAQRRQRVSEMSLEDLRKELLTSDKTGIPNRRAFEDAQHTQPSPAVAMSDADGLKALNDRFGYEAGDALLKAKADALKEAGLDSYHDKGDEFMHRGESPESLKEKLEKAREILRNRVIEVKMKDGTVKRFKGADFSFGVGKDLAESETGLKEHKNTREAAGERARGELRGITEIPPEAKDTPEFKQWFGGSKVVGPQGEPMVVHHQTWNEIVGDWDRQWAAKKFGRDMEGTDTVGMWFSDHPDLGKYGPRNVDAYLKINNPKVYEDIGTDRNNSAFMQLRDDIKEFGGATKFRDYMKKKGYDGILLKNAHIDFDKANTWIALDNDQIKIERQTVTKPDKIREADEFKAKQDAQKKAAEAAKSNQAPAPKVPPQLEKSAGRVIDTAKAEDQELGRAAYIKNGEVIAHHVTDDPENVVKHLKTGKPITEGGTGADGGVYRELGPGLYASDVPEYWKNRSTGKYGFLGKITSEQSAQLADAIQKKIDAMPDGYLTSSERESAERYLDQYRKDQNPGTVTLLADQPYNVEFWKPEFLQKVGIESSKQPDVIEVRAKGNFVEAKHYLNQAEWKALQDAGFDGAWIRAGMGSDPQLVIWNRDAITQFGDWKPEAKDAGSAPQKSPKEAREAKLEKPALNLTPEIAKDANGNPVLTPEAIDKWSRYMGNYPFKTPEEAREWLYNRLEHEDKQTYAEMFGKNGPEKNRQIADSMPLYKHGKHIKIGKKEKPGPVSKERIGTERAEGDVPNIDWHARDLQDSSNKVTKETILRDYNNGKAAQVYKAYVDVDELPEEQLAEEQDIPEGEESETSYDWDSLGMTGRYKAVPPIKIRVKKNGKIDILDGNHRTRFWKQRGFTSLPAWVIDQRTGIKGLEDEE